MRWFKKENYKIKEWSGGITTQLYIFPEEAEVDKRNFLFRISSARIEESISVFSHFNGYARLLMPLSSAIDIQHKNKEKKTLHPFDVHSFSGDWPTTSQGKCTDFNLIFRPEIAGKMEALHLPKGDSRSLSLDSEFDLLFVYLYEGQLSVQTKLLEKGNSLLLEKDDIAQCITEEDSCLILVHVKKDN